MGRRKMSTDEFIIRAIKVHGKRYDYSESVFDRIDRQIEIVCFKHGIFNQMAGNHLRGYGCKQCSVEKQSKTTRQFVQQATKVHGNKYDYSETKYINDKTKVVIICLQHGAFEQKPNKHIQGTNPTGCPRCANKYQTTEDFIRKSLLAHSTKYDYTNSSYVNDTTKIRVDCYQHGSFWQLPSNHHSLGQGCPECKLEKARDNIGYYNEILFEASPELKAVPAKFYKIKLFDERETFYKVGITTQENINKRFSGFPYFVEILSSQEMTLYEAFCLEQKILKEVVKYRPLKKFCGWTECFKN